MPNDFAVQVQMYMIEIICAVFVLFGVFRGFMNGFAKEFGNLVRVFLSAVVALSLYDIASTKIYTNTMVSQPLVEFSMLLLLYFFFQLIFKLVIFILSKIVSFQFVYFIERILGALTGGVRYGVFICFLSYLVLILPWQLVKTEFEKSPYAGPALQQIHQVSKAYVVQARDVLLKHYGVESQPAAAPNAAPQEQPATTPPAVS